MLLECKQTFEASYVLSYLLLLLVLYHMWVLMLCGDVYDLHPNLQQCDSIIYSIIHSITYSIILFTSHCGWLYYIIGLAVMLIK